MRSSELLNHAKEYLRDGRRGSIGRTRYICNALEYVAANSATTQLDAKKITQLQKEIGRRLGNNVSVRSWLHNVHCIPLCELTDENVQAYRHRWVDHLIEEYVAKGD